MTVDCQALMSKRPWWYLNAARRTLTTALPSLARSDDAWASIRLVGGEYELFMRLAPTERAHGVDVAKKVLDACPEASTELVRASLLHDVGKLGFDNGVVQRVIAHLLPLPQVGDEPRLTGLAGVRQARLHHAAYGERLVLDAGSDARVARLVRIHHDPGDDAEALLLHRCDELT